MRVKYQPKPGILYAAECGDNRDLRAHLKAGADPNTSWLSGVTPLMAAAFEGHARACRILLESGADLNLYDTDQGWSAVHDAVRGGHLAILRLLVAHGADVLEHERTGGSLLCLAAQANSRASLKLTDELLSHGCDPNLLGHGISALHVAASSHNFATARVLVRHGANPRSVSEEGFSVWDHVTLNYEGKELASWKELLGL
ncbi:MAG: ankyrin repeat domain-containing protein [Fimbriimonas sp.]